MPTPRYIVIHFIEMKSEFSLAELHKVICQHCGEKTKPHFIVDYTGRVHATGYIETLKAGRGMEPDSYIHIYCARGDSSQLLPPKILEALIDLTSRIRKHFHIDGADVIEHQATPISQANASPTGLQPLLQRIRERSIPSEHTPLLDLTSVEAPHKEESLFAADVKITSIERKQGFLLFVKGTVENIGAKTWNETDDDSYYPIRIGLIVYSDKNGVQEIIEEKRYELPPYPISQSHLCSFSFELNTYALPPGSLQIIVSMVRERDFWFHQRGSIPAIESIQIEQTIKAPAVLNSKYKLPTTSDAVRILYIGPTLPLFDRDTGGRRLFSILESYRKIGFEVTVVYESPGILGNPQKYIEKLTSSGIRVFQGPLSYLAECSTDDFSLCILGWYSCAEKYISLVRHIMPEVKIIVDSVDIHWVRESRGLLEGMLSVTPDEIQKNKAKEVSTYRSADEIWVVSEEDRQALLEVLPTHPSKIISLMSEPNASLYNPSAKDLVFIGSFDHPPNISAALWGTEICTELRKKGITDFTYFIVGANPPQEIKKLHDGQTIIVTGFVESLEPYYRCAKALLAPIRYGAGVKGKITDAACFGIPVITTPVGNEGIGLMHNREGWICSSTEEFVQTLQKIYVNEFNTAQIAELGTQRVLSSTGRHAALSSLQAAAQCKKITISIITYNRIDLITRCLTSLLTKTQFPDWSIHIISNGCTDGTWEYLNELQRQHPSLVVAIRNEENDYFIRPNNTIIHSNPDSDIVLLNNDTIIEDPRWLYELQSAAYTSAHIAASGCLILDEQGQVSEAGGRIYADGSGVNIGRGSQKNDAALQRFKYTGFVSGCCLYMRREMITRFGSLDEDLHPMYYEDVEWQYRLHSFGYKTLWTPRTHIVHAEGSTAGRDIKAGMKLSQESNRMKFVEKFKGVDLESLSD